MDRVKIDSITKFSYLKDLLLPKVRANIEGLAFTTEGYERAKQILKSTFCKSSEIINAYQSNQSRYSLKQLYINIPRLLFF